MCPAPTAAVSPRSPRSSSACSRAAIASSSRSVRYSSTESASSRSARAAGSSPTCAQRESRRTRRPPGARPHARTPRPPRRARSAGSGRRRAAAAAWWASTLASPPTASSASIIAACSAGSAPGATAPSTADRAISCRNATPRPLPVEQAGGRERPDRRPPTRRGPPSSALLTRSGAHDEQLEAVPLRRARGPPMRAITASRTLSGSGDVRLGEDLADEERVARRAPVDVGRVEPVPVEQLGDGGPAQRGELHAGAPREWRRDRPAPGCSGWSAPSVSRHDSTISNGSASMRRARNRTRSSGRLVGPVQVLHDEHARACRAARPAPRRRSRAGPPRRAAAGGDGGPELARDVAQRAERARGAQRVAHAPQHRHRHPLGERAQEAGLADARLTGEQHQAAATRRRPVGPGSRSTSTGARAPAAAPDEV